MSQLVGDRLVRRIMTYGEHQRLPEQVIPPGHRSEDTVRKSTEQLAAGVGQYWLADPTEQSRDVFER